MLCILVTRDAVYCDCGDRDRCLGAGRRKGAARCGSRLRSPVSWGTLERGHIAGRPPTLCSDAVNLGSYTTTVPARWWQIHSYSVGLSTSDPSRAWWQAASDLRVVWPWWLPHVTQWARLHWLHWAGDLPSRAVNEPSRSCTLHGEGPY